MPTLAERRDWALARVTSELDARIARGATIAVTGGTCVVELDLESQTRWDVLDRWRSELPPGSYPMPIKDVTGAVLTLADAAAVHEAARTILLTVLAHRAAAMAARGNVRAAGSLEAVDTALAAYLGAP